jgi:glucosamine-6-phosphate deaminase
VFRKKHIVSKALRRTAVKREEKVINKKDLYAWCSIPADELEDHKNLKIRFRLVESSEEMGRLMAREFIDEIIEANKHGRVFRAIVPCGPKSWYEPFAGIINAEKVSLKNVVVFHMDECLDWEGNPLAKNDPYNFQTFMEKHFYDPIDNELAVKPENRIFLNPETMRVIKEKIRKSPVDYTLGGWGQDGHIAYNQSRRNPFSLLSLEDLRNASIRIQDNNVDTIIALGQRSFGAAYQFVPPMSITLGIKECLSAGKIRVFSDTGSWKQTALRTALFSEPDPEYPMTLLQEHPDAIITATRETAAHPISLHPEWEFKGINERASV